MYKKAEIVHENKAEAERCISVARESIDALVMGLGLEIEWGHEGFWFTAKYYDDEGDIKMLAIF